MTIDHIPEGYIGFKEAFEKYCEKVASTDFKVLAEDREERGVQAKELDDCADNFIAAFAAGKLTAYFSELQFNRNHAVSSVEWSCSIASLACWRGRLDIAGRSTVIFIDASVFGRWLSGVRKGGGKPHTKPGRPRSKVVLAENAIKALYPKGNAGDVKLEMLWSRVKEHIAPDTVGRETVRRAKMQITANCKILS